MEIWRPIPDFSKYEVSSHARLARTQDGKLIIGSKTNYGDPKVSLVGDEGFRHSLSIRVLVAQAFVPQPNESFDSVITKDDDRKNCRPENLAWRPYWYAYRYARQFKLTFPAYYYRRPVINTVTGDSYRNIVEAGIQDGVLFEDIDRGIREELILFPYGYTYEWDD